MHNECGRIVFKKLINFMTARDKQNCTVSQSECDVIAERRMRERRAHVFITYIKAGYYIHRNDVLENLMIKTLNIHKFVRYYTIQFEIIAKLRNGSI